MKFSKFKDLKNFSKNEIQQEIEIAQKELFIVIFKRATRQSFKSHQIKFLKRRIAQLKTFQTYSLEVK